MNKCTNPFLPGSWNPSHSTRHGGGGGRAIPSGAKAWRRRRLGDFVTGGRLGNGVDSDRGRQRAPAVAATGSAGSKFFSNNV